MRRKRRSAALVLMPSKGYCGDNARIPLNSPLGFETRIKNERAVRKCLMANISTLCASRWVAAAVLLVGSLIASGAVAQNASCSGPLRKVNVGVSVSPPNVVHTAAYVAKELGL